MTLKKNIIHITTLYHFCWIIGYLSL